MERWSSADLSGSEAPIHQILGPVWSPALEFILSASRQFCSFVPANKDLYFSSLYCGPENGK